jgi:glycosyltransferase involved in cell wall biosynthesis
MVLSKMVYAKSGHGLDEHPVTTLQWLDIDYVCQQIGETLSTDFSKYQQKNEPLSHTQQVEAASALIAKAASPDEIRLNRWFDVATYLELRNDVKREQINPSLHFFAHGYKETEWPEFMAMPSEYINRVRIREDTGKTYVSPAQVKAEWNPKRPFTLISATRIASIIFDASGNNHLFIVSFSHDDAYVKTGGIQKIIREETSASIANKFGYIHISPFSPHPCIEDILPCQEEASLCNVRYNGKELGTILQSSIPILLRKIAYKDTIISIHHFFGFDISSSFFSIAKSSTQASLFYWAHDYSACCQGYTLLMDGINFCGAPSLPSMKCEHCSYGSHRSEYLSKIGTLFSSNQVTIVHPSRASFEQFNLGQSAVTPRTGHVILPHIEITDYTVQIKQIDALGRKVRVAYVGTPVRHKGFDEFAALARDSSLHQYFEWIHIGIGSPSLDIPSIYVDGIDANGMEKALIDNDIDIAFIWPLWPETFCFVAFEALSAGCHILTNNNSGNITSSLPSAIYTAFDSIDQAREWLFCELAINSGSLAYAEDVSIKNSSYTLSFVNQQRQS